jgi:hypothetical protein
MDDWFIAKTFFFSSSCSRDVIFTTQLTQTCFEWALWLGLSTQPRFTYQSAMLCTKELRSQQSNIPGNRLGTANSGSQQAMEQAHYSKLLGTMGARTSIHPIRLSIDKSRGTSQRTATQPTAV